MAQDGAEHSLLQIALGCRCPRCGIGPLYRGVLTVRETCSVCGLDLSQEDAGDGGAVFVTLILGAIVVGLGFALDHFLAPPFWLQALIWIPFTFGGAILMLRPIKAGLIAQQYRMRDLGTPPPGN